MQPAAHLPHSLTCPSLSVIVAHQNKVGSELEEPKLCLGARKETLLGSDSVNFCEDSSLGAGPLLPKSGTSAMYWPGVSWLMQPLYVVLKWP